MSTTPAVSLPPALVTAALVGAARGGLPEADALPPALAGWRDGLAERPPEQALLLLAGAAALYNAAGRLPERADGVEWRLPAFRPEGDRQPCSPAAARHLERHLTQKQQTSFLSELLELLDRAGQRVPDFLLPDILEHGARVPRIRPSLLPILGERGRWLASMNPAWRYAAVDPADMNSLRGAWDADPKGRGALATTVRRHDPTRARALIETTWRNEPEQMRRELLGVLETGLSMTDEPFLERALDDRDAIVRRRAAELLAALPDSRLAARVTAAAGGILVLTKGALAPVFPQDIPESLYRDGVTRHDIPGRPAPERTAADWSRLLMQTVGAIPLAHWEARFGLEPPAIVAAALAGRWPRTLLTAFATAAQRQNNPPWIDALLEGDGYSERVGRLVQTLEPETCYARLAQAIAADDEAMITVFLRRWRGAWDEASGRALLDFLGQRAAAARTSRLETTLLFLSRQFAHQCPPSLADYARETFLARAASPAWGGAATNVVTILATRARMAGAVG